MKFEDLKNKIAQSLLIEFQNPTLFKIVVLSLICILGLGGIGIPLNMSIKKQETLNAEQQERRRLIKLHDSYSTVLSAYKSHLSDKSEFIEWVSEIRDIMRQNGLSVQSITPVINAKEADSKTLRKLIIKMTANGKYIDIIRTMGIFYSRNEKVNITNFHIGEIELAKDVKTCQLTIQLGMLMQPASAQKKVLTAEDAKTAPDQTRPAQAAAPAAEAKPAPEVPASKARAMEEEKNLSVPKIEEGKEKVENLIDYRKLEQEIKTTIPSAPAKNGDNGYSSKFSFDEPETEPAAPAAKPQQTKPAVKAPAPKPQPVPKAKPAGRPAPADTGSSKTRLDD